LSEQETEFSPVASDIVLEGLFLADGLGIARVVLPSQFLLVQVVMFVGESVQEGSELVVVEFVFVVLVEAVLQVLRKFRSDHL
jgi:hypothetical protein